MPQLWVCADTPAPMSPFCPQMSNIFTLPVVAKSRSTHAGTIKNKNNFNFNNLQNN